MVGGRGSTAQRNIVHSDCDTGSNMLKSRHAIHRRWCILLRRSPAITHSCSLGVLKILVLCLFAVVHARYLRTVRQISNVCKGVHVALARLCLVICHQLAALQHFVVASSQHAAWLDFWLCDIDIEPADRTSLDVSSSVAYAACSYNHAHRFKRKPSWAAMCMAHGDVRAGRQCIYTGQKWYARIERHKDALIEDHG